MPCRDEPARLVEHQIDQRFGDNGLAIYRDRVRVEIDPGFQAHCHAPADGHAARQHQGLALGARAEAELGERARHGCPLALGGGGRGGAFWRGAADVRGGRP